MMFFNKKKSKPLTQKAQLNYNKKEQLSQIYQYLLQNCYGYENRLKAWQIMPRFQIRDHKTFRNKIENIRQSKQFGFISSEAGKNGGYWIPKDKEEATQTLIHLSCRSLKMDTTCSILEEKIRRDVIDGKL